MSRRWGLPLQRVTTTALCLVWPLVGLLHSDFAQAEPLPLLSSLRTTAGDEELHLLGLLPLDELLPTLKNASLQRTFIEALPTDWALPTFSASSVAELAELQSWLSKVRQHVDFDKLRGVLDPLGASRNKEKRPVMHEMLEAIVQASAGEGSPHGGVHHLLFGENLQSTLPSLLRDYAASLPVQGLPTVQEILQSASALALDDVFLRKVQLLQRLPSLDQLDVSKFVDMFAVPSDIDWPVARSKLALLLPVLTSAEDGGLLGSPRTALVEGTGLTAFQTESSKLLLPLTQPDGQLLFAKLNEIFSHMRLPHTIKVLPVATLQNTELPTVEALWAGMKSALLPRQALMSADDSRTLRGPVLNLTNLAKLQLASSDGLRTQFLAHLRPSADTLGSSSPAGASFEADDDNKELLKAFSEALEAGFPLEDALKNVFNELSARLQRAILPFEGLFALDGTLPAPRFQDLSEWKADWEQMSPSSFRDDLFFRLQLPVVAFSRDAMPSTFRYLQRRLPAPCDSSRGDRTCALGLAPVQPPPQEAFEESVAALSRRVEILAEQLKAAVYKLQLKVFELIAAKDGDGGADNEDTDRMASSGADTAAMNQFRSSPSAPHVKVAEGLESLFREQPLFELPNIFTNGGRSKTKFHTLQQALDASVKLCDSLSVILRYTKNEVKVLDVFNGHSFGSGSTGNVGKGGISNRPTYTDVETWEVPDTERLFDSYPVPLPYNDSRKFPFLANIHGRYLVGLPRDVVDELAQKAGGNVKVAQAEGGAPTPHLVGQTHSQNDAVTEADGRVVQERRLQATQATGAPKAKELVLLDPLNLGRLLFSKADGDNLLEELKGGIADATKAIPHLARPATDDEDSTTEASALPPLLENVLGSNSLAFPAFTVPVGDLLRVGVFPDALQKVPIKEWVSPSMRLPADVTQYSIAELLQLQPLTSGLKSLPLNNLLAADAKLPANMFPIDSDMLKQSLGDLHLKSLIPSQLADLPLAHLLKLPQESKTGHDEEEEKEENEQKREEEEEEEGAEPASLDSLSLGKLLLLDDATISLLTQPFGDALGLKRLLEKFGQFQLVPAPPEDDGAADENPDGTVEQPALTVLNGGLAAGPLKVLESLRLPVGVSTKGRRTDLLDFALLNWLAPGIVSEKEKNGKAARQPLLVAKPYVAEGSSFLQGKKKESHEGSEAHEGLQQSGSLTLANLAQGVRSRRPMTDLFRHLWNTAGVTFANELFF